MRPQNLLTKVNEVDYEQAVSLFYEPLYGFAYSLSGNENDACELTQETFARLLAKSGQLRDGSKVKPWLFTTLYRVFLGWKSRERRLPHLEISSVEHELPPIAAELVDTMERDTVREALLEIDERYRAPLTLYYLEEHSYEEIAELLEIPIGTVMSRLSRAKALMREALATKSMGERRKIVPLDQASKLKQSLYE
jgi:RNA polymerase sigma factor (sigma-70 family)